jgi:DNA-binding transcriptional MerR regulator
MKPGDAAKFLGVDRSTITRWTAHEFRQYMTPGAQGGSGKNRVMTDRDLRVLYLIKTLKDTNTPAEEIHTALQQLERDGWEGLPAMPAAPSAMAEFPVVPVAASDAALSAERRALLREISFLQQRIEQLETDLKAERTDRDELVKRLARAETLLDLWETGRIKSKE